MIEKTNAASTAIRPANAPTVNTPGEGRGFAAALEEQRQKVEARPEAPEASSTSRVPIGRRAMAAQRQASAAAMPEASTSRAPLGRDRAASGSAAIPPGTTASEEAASSPNLATADNAVRTTGTISEDPRTAGMYMPPDFYHGTSYSPVFDQQDADGNWVPTPRFEGQKIYSPWRGSLPDDFDPNARVVRDPLAFQNGSNFWSRNEDGTWSRRDTGYGGIPLYDDGKPVFTPDPLLYPDYFV